MARKKASTKRLASGKRKKTPIGRKRRQTGSKPKAAAKRRKAARARSASSSRPRPRARFTDDDRRGLGSESGGQAGDTAGLARGALADSESVEELVEEGQAFEAGVVSGVENAPDAGADRRGVRTRQVPEDDVPQEYLDED